MLIKSGTNDRKKNPLSEFIKKNKSMVYLLPILFILIVVVAIMYSKPQNKAKPAVPSSASSQNAIDNTGNQNLKVEVLPQMERVKQPENLDISQVDDPFEAGESSVYLKGVVLSDNTGTAIIETDSRAYIVSVGDSFESFWQVEKIEERKVTLKDRNGVNLVLTMN
jgi:hypothetical protein